MIPSDLFWQRVDFMLRVQFRSVQDMIEYWNLLGEAGRVRHRNS